MPREIAQLAPLRVPALADAADTGTLGIPYLKRYWSRTIAARLGVNCAAPDGGGLHRDSVLLAGLRLGVRETLNFLMDALPSFEAFEAWVLEKNGGTIEQPRFDRLNAALRGESAPALETISAEPALSSEDLTFWDQQGYVVLKRAVSADQCQAAVDAIFSHAGMSLEQPDSWYRDSLYKDGLWIPLAHHPALWANRNSPRIHTAFAQIWHRAGLSKSAKNGDLWMNVDVCGVNPPLRAGYDFRGTPLHWDMTLAPPVRFGTQAILYLTDTAANQGAFSCVPGFHRMLERWLAELPPGASPRTQAVQDLQAQPIVGNAGDLIIWHQALPHAATPNLGAFPRVTQYLNMFPSELEVNADWI